MKNYLFMILCFATILVPGILKAQYAIPNGSFENWDSIYKPADWKVVQGEPTQGHEFGYTVIDSAASTDTTTDSVHLVQYAWDGLSFINMPMADSTTPCIISQKFPMKSRPDYFSMNFAYLPETQYNQFQVSFIFTKWNTTTRQEDTVLAGDYNSKPGHMDSAWTTLKVANLSSLYNPNITGNPDSAIVIITSSLQSSPNLKTVLAIDEIYFTDTAVTTGIKIPENENISGAAAFPNPFSSETNIQYSLQTGGQVSLDVYDVNGRIVANLVNGNQVAGFHQTAFNASGLQDGIYFYKLQSANDIQTGKLILSKQ